jgi:hypothetical protein
LLRLIHGSVRFLHLNWAHETHGVKPDSPRCGQSEAVMRIPVILPTIDTKSFHTNVGCQGTANSPAFMQAVHHREILSYRFAQEIVPLRVPD